MNAERLTDEEYEVLCGVFAGRSTMPNDLIPVIQGILAGRSAQALRDAADEEARRRWQYNVDADGAARRHASLDAENALRLRADSLTVSFEVTR